MKCPYCECDGSRVLDSRVEGGGIKRFRRCDGCLKRFPTYEYNELMLESIKRGAIGLAHKMEYEINYAMKRWEKLLKEIRR